MFKTIATQAYDTLRPWTKSILVITTVGVTIHQRKAILLYARGKWGMRVATSAIQLLTSYQVDDLRKHFRQVLVNASTFTAHSHPNAASTRTWANNVLRQVITMSGFIPYSVSMSAKDVRDGIAGSRLYYTAKDLTMRPRYDKVTKNHAYMLVDVDYYVDMSSLLDGHPVAIYTFSPLAPGGTTANSTYSISNDTVTEKINGGGEYSHQLWDYDHDHLIVDHWYYSAVYLVEQRKTNDPNRKLIIFVPIAIVYGVGWLLPGARLERRKITHGEANYTRFQRQEGENTVLYHSFCFQGATTVATIDDRSFETILHRTSLSKNPQISDVERILNSLAIGDSKIHASVASVFIALWKYRNEIFTQYRRIQTCGFDAVDSFTYQTLGPLITEDGSPAMRQVMKPYLHNAYVAARSYNNDVACIDGRIKAVQNTVKSYPPFMMNCFQEFVRFVVPDNKVGEGSPLSTEEVEERQTRPTQRAKAESNRFWGFHSSFNVKAFQKAEAYQKITDPRNISTVPTDHQIRLSAFTYVIADLMKAQHWYAFGKHPTVFTEVLRTKASTAAMCVPSDISRLDGSCGSIHSQLVSVIFSRYFNQNYRPEVEQLLSSEHNAKGITTYQVKYNTGHTTISGSPVTSIRNSLINAFHCYYALRMTYDDANVAYSRLGVYGGDDGVTFDVDPVKLVSSFAKGGLTIKADVVPKSHPVMFLGRVFIDLWSTNESLCDVLRQVNKIHLTNAPILVPNHLVLRRKALGYIATDGNTPFITAWSKAVIRITDNMTFSTQDEKLADQTIRNRWFENFDTPFEPLSDIGHDYSMNLVAGTMHISVPELTRLEGKFNAAQTIEDLETGFLNTIRTPAQVTAAIGGSIIRKENAQAKSGKVHAKQSRRKVSK